MADAITLSTVQQTSLVARERIASVRNAATEALSTGRSVNRATDDARAYLLSKGLSDRADDLLAAKSEIFQGIDTLVAVKTGIKAIDRLTRQLTGIAEAARSANTADRADFARQFDTVRQQIDLLAADVSYQGVNLLSNPADTLRVGLSDNAGSNLEVQGRASDVSSLGINEASTSYANFVSDNDIDNALTALGNARANLRASEASIVGNTSILQTRGDFTDNLANVLQGSANRLVEADLNAESARILSANARDALSLEGQRISANSESQIAQLLKGA